MTSDLIVLVGLGFVPLAAAITAAVVRAARPDPRLTQGTALQMVVTVILVAGGQLLAVPFDSALVHVAALIPPLMGALTAKPRGWRRAVRGAMAGSLVTALGLLTLYLLLMINFMIETG